MEVETPTPPNFDMQSKPSFSFPSTVVCSQECVSSEVAAALDHDYGLMAADADLKYHDSESSVFEDRGVKSTSTEVREGATSESVVALISSTKSAAINGRENGSSESTAAVRVQKVYRSYRTRRRLADSAVVAEELWWQAIDFARLNYSTISFFNFLKPETAASRWSRITLNASKVGKGLSRDDKAQKLAFQHWIEAIDPRHRYGHNLHLYYEEWCKADAGQPFFHWLDVGDGKEADLKECPRSKLRKQCIRYLGPQEREHYEYIIVEGKIYHKQTEMLLDTNQRAKWIFVMSTSKKLYAGEKKKGLFHHSSFLAGGATLAAGRLSAENGVLKTISAYSGHYRPSEETLNSFLGFLKDNGVTGVEIRYTEDFDNYEDKKSIREEGTIGVLAHPELPQLETSSEVEKNLPAKPTEITHTEPTEVGQSENKGTYRRTLSGGLQSPRADVPQKKILERINSKKAAHSYQLGHQLSTKWSTGAGPRIGCVKDYPVELRVQALEFVNLSPRAPPTPSTSRRPPGLISPTFRPKSDLNNGDRTSAA